MNPVIEDALLIFDGEVLEVRDLGARPRVVVPLADVLGLSVAFFRNRTKAVVLAFDGQPVDVASGPSAASRLREAGIPSSRFFTVRTLETLVGSQRGERVAGLICRALIGGPTRA
jgi:hypothetical protein